MKIQSELLDTYLYEQLADWSEMRVFYDIDRDDGLTYFDVKIAYLGNTAYIRFRRKAWANQVEFELSEECWIIADPYSLKATKWFWIILAPSFSQYEKNNYSLT